jgi:hypothetical protein
LRWISGSSYYDIQHTSHISITSFNASIQKCTSSILNRNHLVYSFPTTNKELILASVKLNKIITNNAIEGCLAAVDGYLLEVGVPSTSEVGKLMTYLSGNLSSETTHTVVLN